MNLHDLLPDPLSLWLNQDTRAIRLRFGQQLDAQLGDVLLPQRLHASEGICEGLTLHLTCLTPNAATCGASVPWSRRRGWARATAA
jgi:hypothetical protein